MMRAIALLGFAIAAGVAVWIALPRTKPDAPRPVVAFLADTVDVAPGIRIDYAGVSIGEVTSSRRVGNLTRIEFRLTRPDVPLRTADRLRRVVSPLGFTSRLAIAPGPPDAPLFSQSDSLAAAPTLDLADTIDRATTAIPGIVRDVRRGVDEIKKRPRLYQP
jgi:hypothetical protein